METQWITWALQALILAVLYWFKQQLDSNTNAVNDLREELPKTYMPRMESEAVRKELRENYHDLRNKVQTLEVKVAGK